MNTPVALALALTAATDVEVTTFEAPYGPRGADIRCLTTDAEGAMWIGTGGAGVSRFADDEWQHFGEDVLGMGGVTSIFRGADGELWFTGGGGVTRFDGAEWTRYDDELGRAIRVVYTGTVDADGSVWFATNAGAVRFARDAESDATWTWITSENGLLHDVVHDVQRDATGNLWFATRRGGLSRQTPTNEWEHFHANDNFRAIVEDADGALWFGTGGGGVLRFEDGEWTRHRAGETVLPLFDDSRGNVWFSRGDGTLRYREGAWSEHGEHLPAGDVEGGAEGADRSLWFGTRSGLVRLRKEE